MARQSSLVLLRTVLLLLPLKIGCGGASPSDATLAALRFDACAPLALVLEADATMGEMSGAQAALDLWNQTASTRLSLTASAGDAAAIPLRFQAAAALSHGVYEPGIGEIFINTDLVAHPHALAVTIAHELGHAFGLAHVGGRPSVMTAGNIDVEPNSGDVDALAVLWGRCTTVVQP